MAELADAPDLGSGGNPVQVRVLLSAAKRLSHQEISWGGSLFPVRSGSVINNHYLDHYFDHFLTDIRSFFLLQTVVSRCFQ